MPPLVPLPRPPDQMTSLTTNSDGQGAHAELAEQLGVDGVVADAERPGIDKATETDDEAADHRPPHPVQMAGQLLEQVLGPVDGLGHQPGGEATGDADRRRSEQDHAAERRRATGTGKIGCGATRPALAITMRRPSAVAAAMPMRTIERGLNSKASSSTPNKRGGDRGAEHRAHPCCGPGDQEALALGGGEMEELADDRAHGTAGQDDRSLGAERARRSRC